MSRAVRVPCRGLAAARFRPERNSFSDTRPFLAKSFKPHAPYSLSGAPFSGHIMTAIDRTAYPRPRARLSREELGFRYDLTETDLTFVRANARGDNGRLLLAVLLKSRRDFGCFPGLGEVHAGIVVHVASQLGLETLHPPTDDMRRSSKLYRYQAAVRAHLCVRPYGKWAERLLIGTILDAAETMSDPADLINRAIQALQSAAVDLPGFSTLDRLVSRLRAEIHRPPRCPPWTEMGTPSRPPWSAASALTRASTSAASGNTSSTWPTCRPRSIRNHCRSRKPERAHRYSNSDASPDLAVIQLVGAFRAYPQLTSGWGKLVFLEPFPELSVRDIPVRRDETLDTLLYLDGEIIAFDEEGAYWVKFEVRRIPETPEKPHALDYSLTLHGPVSGDDDSRLVGFDNAHQVRGKRRDPSAWDHKHRFKSVRPYDYSDAAALLADFWAAVESVLDERGINP